MKERRYLTLLPYDVNVFQHLNDFFIARDVLEKHRVSITRLGDIICAHGFERHVGINLLPKHFDIDEGELVVREFETASVARMRPRMIADCPDVIPYVWKLGVGNHGKGFYPLEFIRPFPEHRDDATAETERIGSADGFLDGLATTLEELGLQELYGIAALESRRPFALDENSTLLETTDKENRVLTLEIAAKQRLKTLETTQTLWIFTPARQFITGSECIAHCISHCHGHCVRHDRPQTLHPQPLPHSGERDHAISD
jgi:hypothetical protein